jgi:hypothetical protein
LIGNVVGTGVRIILTSGVELGEPRVAFYAVTRMLGDASLNS